jgi:hypothetical protein
VRELQAGLWHWQAPHPDWTPGERWSQEVSSYAIDDGERLLFFDPLAVPDELMTLAPEREPVIVLTAPWHERDTQALVGRLGAAVFAPRPTPRRTSSTSTASPPSRPVTAARTCSGFGAAAGTSTGMRRVTGF